MSHSPTRQEQIQADLALIAGITQSLPTATFMLEGKMVPAADVIALLERRVRIAQEVLLVEAAWHGAIQRRDAHDAETASFVEGVRQTVLAMFSRDPEALVPFGVRPRKKPEPRTGEELVIAAAKAAATRKARYTMSPRARSKIHGVLTGPVVLDPADAASARAREVEEPAPAQPGAASTGAPDPLGPRRDLK